MWIIWIFILFVLLIFVDSYWFIFIYIYINFCFWCCCPMTCQMSHGLAAIQERSENNNHYLACISTNIKQHMSCLFEVTFQHPIAIDQLDVGGPTISQPFPSSWSWLTSHELPATAIPIPIVTDHTSSDASPMFTRVNCLSVGHPITHSLGWTSDSHHVSSARGRVGAVLRVEIGCQLNCCLAQLLEEAAPCHQHLAVQQPLRTSTR